MDYEKVYFNICQRGKTSRDLDYFERHHIIPRCIGGGDEETNLTKLTAREHYIAHHLLIKIYPMEIKLVCAFGAMGFWRNKRKLAPRQYERLKVAYSEYMKINNPMFKNETRKKMSDTKKKQYKTGEIVPRDITTAERKNISTRMKTHNPSHLYPERINTAKPIIVLYTDGRTENYDYAKKLHYDTGIPYETIKYMLKKNTGSRKHGIVKIIPR